MGLRHFQIFNRSGIIILATMLITGCSGYGGGKNGGKQQITIDSEPQNASVYVNGVEIGTTPLSINPGDHYQASFTSGGSSGGIVVFRYVGTLVVKKPGCKDFSTQVDDNILSKDIDIQLECDPTYKPAVVQPVAPVPVIAPATLEKQPPMSSGDAEERLLRIESLHDKGLLNDKEYKALRQRVMDTL